MQYADLTRPQARQLSLALAGLLLAFSAHAQQVQVGTGRLWLDAKPAESMRPKPAPYRSADMAQRALPTNTWYSSLAYMRWSDVLHAHPLSFKATESGFEMGLPTAARGPISRLKPWASAGGKDVVVTHQHQADLSIWPTRFAPKDARLAAAGDWNIGISMANGNSELSAQIAHGSPFAYYRINDGGVRITVPEGARLDAGASPGKGGKRIHYLSVGARNYAIYLPASAQLERSSPQALTLTFAENAGYFSVAVLPDAQPATLQAFSDAAFAFVQNTEVRWRYDEASSQLDTDYLVSTQVMDGLPAAPLLGVYLHQKKWLSQPTPGFIGALPSVRGPISLVAANSFSTRMPFNGLMALWPGLQSDAKRARLAEVSVGDQRRAPGMFGKMGNGTYWTGKALGAIAQHMVIAEQNGDAEAALALEKILKTRMETWFSGQSAAYFAYDKNIGAILGYPEEYFSVSAMNDHHFHYGYWITAAAQLARRDPAWASNSRWGGMVNLLVKDIANAQRKRPDFPFLRNFDVYEGHSWARGNSEFFGHGNDQESSSEAIHAWAGVALWGEMTGDKTLRDTGVYLYLTEVASVLSYWFDKDGEVLDKSYGKPVASMVFGGAYGYSTWWTEEPRQILGINLLPITPASVYLASLSKDYVERYLQLAEDERKVYDNSGQSDGTAKDIWQDIYASFLGLKNPAAALKKWDSKGTVEAGETRTRTMFWLESLAEMGTPQPGISADTFSYAVFRKADTGQTTYLAHNASDAPKTVRFSDGTEMVVPAHRLARVVKTTEGR